MLSISRTIIRQFALALLMTGIQAAHAEGRFHRPFEVTGSVLMNPDGDTLKLMTDERGLINIRLSGADTPETGQAYWRSARNYLRSLVAGQKTTAWCYKEDRFYRQVCHVRVGNRDVGQAMIEAGYAWYAFQFSPELTREQRLGYPEAERQAKAGRIGIWQEPNPMAPWECRRLKRTGKGQLCR
ncbi:thermonuclease family protein [Azonexus hydrophilus]|uniref:thermonuclease family protein n=2 Tax=Azonexus hydrophilus TaxID=418702 RepID=UPI003C781999